MYVHWELLERATTAAKNKPTQAGLHAVLIDAQTPPHGTSMYVRGWGLDSVSAARGSMDYKRHRYTNYKALEIVVICQLLANCDEN